jgi:hypothetical protein
LLGEVQELTVSWNYHDKCWFEYIFTRKDKSDLVLKLPLTKSILTAYDLSIRTALLNHLAGLGKVQLA